MTRPMREATTRPMILKNVTCPYCRSELDANTRTKEHVVGRRFVPKGKLQGCWNLILAACSDCNNVKSTLEDDLSAISMIASLTGGPMSSDPEALQDARRKAARSISRRTGRRVAASEENLTVAGPLGPGGRYTASLISPPQADESRVYALARLHFLAFFYHLTYEETTKRGRVPSGVFLPIDFTVRSDWGNPLQVGFMEETISWWTRMVGISANEYFRIAIRKCPGIMVWSCALEWNASVRVLALVGDEECARKIAAGFPTLKLEVFGSHGGGVWRGRSETELIEDEDVMFADGTPEPAASAT